jgi:molybdopterin-guanine dinucleotide biosynthesis protein B
MRVYGIVGWKNSGKTTLVERLVTEITIRGFSVSTVKHAHHTFDVDHEGKDSFRHRAAGATEVLLASRNRWALMHEIRDGAEPPLSELLEKISPVDLVLIEGYKRGNHAKVEAHRTETKQGLLSKDDATITAIASNDVIDGLSVPQFELDDVTAIASYILKEVGLE